MIVDAAIFFGQRRFFFGILERDFASRDVLERHPKPAEDLRQVGLFPKAQLWSFDLHFILATDSHG